MRKRAARCGVCGRRMVALGNSGQRVLPSDIYRRAKVQLTDGSTTKVRVSRQLWDALAEGDEVHQPINGDVANGSRN